MNSKRWKQERPNSAAIVREQILKICSGPKFRTSSAIAEALDMPINSVRSYYLYRMAREGELETLNPLGTTSRQAYRARKASR